MVEKLRDHSLAVIIDALRAVGPGYITRLTVELYKVAVVFIYEDDVIGPVEFAIFREDFVDSPVGHVVPIRSK